LLDTQILEPPSLMYLHCASVARFMTTCVCCAGLLVASPAQAVFFNPPGNQIPSSIGGNSRRGGCAIDEVAQAEVTTQVTTERLVGFLPIVPDPSRVVMLTTQASASLWVYVPPTQARSVEFSLFDNVSGEFVYVGQFAIEAEGIYQINLPETIELKADQSDAPQDYVWFLDLVCDPNNPAANLSQTGTLKRVTPAAIGAEFELQLTAATNSFDRAKTYGNYGLWLDMVAAIVAGKTVNTASDHSTSDTDGNHAEHLQQEWRNLLDMALPLSDREDVDREQQLQRLQEADIFTAEMSEVAVDQ